MSELLKSPAFGIGLTALTYWLGVKIQKKTGLVVCNALILSALMIAAVLVVFRIPYDDYNVGGSFIHMLPNSSGSLVGVHIVLFLLYTSVVSLHTLLENTMRNALCPLK